MRCETSNEYIYLAIKDKLYKICEQTKNTINTILPNTENSTSYIRSIAVRENNVAVITTNKLLMLFNNNLELIEKWTVNRSPSQLCIVDSKRIIVADKTGDIYLYQREKPKPDMILGHLSMILDVKLSLDFKYILSADRDEKIRVSHFPNAYNIQSFCLGHTEFVTTLEVLDRSRIVSGSGDGTIKFWNIENGKELNSINCNDFIADKSILSEFSQKMSDMHINIEVLPVIEVKLKQITATTWHIAVSLFNCNEIQIYEIKILQEKIEYKFLQAIQVELKSTFIFHNNLFYIFMRNNLFVYNFDNSKNYVQISNDKIESNFLKSVVQELSLEDNEDIEDIIHVLFKKSFNNIEDYQQRKKIRLENVT